MAGAHRALGAPRRGVAAFFRGLGMPLRGARRVYLEEPGLVRFWIVPILVTSVALVGSIAAALALHGDVTAWMWAEPADGGFLGVLRGVLDVVVAIAMVLLALALTLLLSGIVAAPFNARLAEVLDEKVTGHVPPPFTVRRALGDVGRAMVIETSFFVFNAVLFVVSLAVPVLGPVLWAVGLGAGALYFAISYVEGPHAARDRSLGDRLRFVGRHLPAMLGFGAGVAIFVFVPLVNLLFMPAAVAGGVLLHAELEPPAAPPARPPAA